MNQSAGMSLVLQEFTSHGSGNGSEREEPSIANEGNELLAAKESTDVLRWKLVVVTMLSVTAVMVLTSTYLFLSKEEEKEFEASFQQSASSIMDSMAFQSLNSGLAYFRMADALTRDGLTTNSKWPFITSPLFEIEAGHMRSDAIGCELVFFTPIVPQQMRNEWEAYSWARQGWVQESHSLTSQTEFIYSLSHTEVGDFFGGDSNHGEDAGNISSSIFHFDPNGTSESDGSFPFFAPFWQSSPPPRNSSIINWNVLSHPIFFGLVNSLIETRKMGMSGTTDMSHLFHFILSDEDHDKIHASSRLPEDLGKGTLGHPHSVVVAPIRKDFGSTLTVVGFLFAIQSWEKFFNRVLPEGSDGVLVVGSDDCGNCISFLVNGPRGYYVGTKDNHDSKFNHLARSIYIPDYVPLGTNTSGYCDVTVRIYPTDTYRARFNSSRPAIFTAIMGAVFLATGLAFYIYVQYVQRRQKKVLATATQTNAIVSSLFPKTVRDRLIQDAAEQAEREVPTRRWSLSTDHVPKSKLKNFLEGQGETNGMLVNLSKPIADLFLETTVMFADLVGFTAWSSMREPSQVFTLLESIYGAFDEIAKLRGVFKVETVGDCYVAVAGLPEPRHDHAVVMAAFARDCNLTMNQIVRQLEMTLGPDTSDLMMRFGLHSGPVTAGVLRGDRARFQLFGDTVNMASRMESTSERGKVQISETTAKLLMEAGHQSWVESRTEPVWIKGKGRMKTFWLSLRASMDKVTSSGPSSQSIWLLNLESTTSDDQGLNIDERTLRLIQWNADSLLRLLRQIECRRLASGVVTNIEAANYRWTCQSDQTVLDEVQETIRLPQFDASLLRTEVDPKTVKLPGVIEAEVKDYVTALAMLYHRNPFHNFEHVSHVAMSVMKLLSRIVAPADIHMKEERKRKHNMEQNAADQLASSLHDHTYGITSDPLTQFACVFSALIHDVDHTGVPNSQVIVENATMANLYKGKSVAEQNSVHMAWTLLMDDRYRNFRCAIYSNENEFLRFRQLVVNSVMATDIMDKDLKSLRNARWDRAFSVEEVKADNTNRKATIVIEHMIQASDVSHTMQHWHVYRKWNERLFREMSFAYKAGRAYKDPADFWYEGELAFFDYYIIPLAKKLKDCGVFGVSSGEYLGYAEMNRQEWETRGQEIVASMIEALWTDENRSEL